MILTRTPFRVSFAGGGSDLPEFYRRSAGAVLSCTIDKAMYIAVHPYFHDKILIKYSRTEDVASAAEVEHPLVRECLNLVGIERGMEIASFADVPAGTGMLRFVLVARFFKSRWEAVRLAGLQILNCLSPLPFLYFSTTYVALGC